MRLFTALDLSPQASEALTRLQAELKEHVPGRRWTAVENIHITVHFLGEVDESRLGELSTLLKAASAFQHPFELELGELGVFGGQAHPRVLWLGLEGDKDALHRLEHSHRDSLESHEYLLEKRRYSPHITLCREPHGPLDLQALKAQFPVAPSPWNITQVGLYQSTLTPKGPIYKLLESYPLQG